MHPAIRFEVFLGPNLEILCIQQSDSALSCENYAKLYFDAKHVGKALNRGGEIFDAHIFKRSALLVNIRLLKRSFLGIFSCLEILN